MASLTDPTGNGVEPGRRIGTSLELPPFPESLQERVLDEVFGLLGAAAHPKAYPIETPRGLLRDLRKFRRLSACIGHDVSIRPLAG